MPTVGFGVNTCFAVKRWPEPEEWSRLLAEMGVTQAQFSFDLADPVMVGDESIYTDTRRACDEAGISITSAFTGLIPYSQNLLGHPSEPMRRQSLYWYRAAIDATAVLGGSAVGGHIGALSVRQYRDPEGRRRGIARIVEGVRELAQHAATRGLSCLLWEIMPVAREYPVGLEECEELMARLDGDTAVPIALCLDMGHACAAGATGANRDPYAWLERLGRYTQVVHVQQTDGVGDRHWPFTTEFNAQGIIDPARVVDLVAQFERPRVEIVLEAISAFEADDDAVLADVQESVAYWQPAMERLGTDGGVGTQAMINREGD
jgi:D-erythrulose 1-phosphate 3-epimerase